MRTRHKDRPIKAHGTHHHRSDEDVAADKKPISTFDLAVTETFHRGIEAFADIISKAREKKIQELGPDGKELWARTRQELTAEQGYEPTDQVTDWIMAENVVRDCARLKVFLALYAMHHK